MVRHKILKKRINLEAWKLKEFTSNQLLEVLNNYTNMDGRNRTKHLQVTIQRLCNLLKQNKNVFLGNISQRVLGDNGSDAVENLYFLFCINCNESLAMEVKSIKGKIFLFFIMHASVFL